MSRKKVFVSGCFDMLHSGHVRFFEEAAAYGDVYVGIGSDRTVMELKGRPPVNTQQERKYMVEAVRHVRRCFVNTGSGIMDFLEQLEMVSPDVIVVNEDGNTRAKAELCRKRGIEYVVLKRHPHANLPARSTTSLRKECRIPYRLDLAGGWLDQPFVSRHAAGPVITISVEPDLEFNERSGMASSSRRRAIELWQTDVPAGDLEKSARTLFACENPPGTEQFSGSQDAIGIVFPGLNRLDYDGRYWPEKIASVHDEKILRWLERHLFLITLGPRKAAFDVFAGKKITPQNARKLAAAADRCWRAILNRDVQAFGNFCRAAFEAQTAMFPKMAGAEVRSVIRQFSRKAAGWKLSGAGGGGYLVLVAEDEVPEAIKIRIRRKVF
jgi:cytidyltransferase-like protein